MQTATLFTEFNTSMVSTKQAFLLLYKEGTNLGKCAMDSFNGVKGNNQVNLFYADVTRVNDIHSRIGSQLVIGFDKKKIDQLLNINQ